MVYQISVRDTGESMRLADDDWRYLLTMAGIFGWNPVAGLDYYLSIPPPDIIPGSVSESLAKALGRSLSYLPERRGPINVPFLQEGGSYADLRNYFGGEKCTVEKFIRLCRLGDLTVRRSLQPEL
ncbi:MAG: hypothetical protein M3P92_01395 [Actinomycetota bacterium]|jgi:hypothetical protein|nr:hypothetical protein [Actinomycetota bacterium]